MGLRQQLKVLISRPASQDERVLFQPCRAWKAGGGGSGHTGQAGLACPAFASPQPCSLPGPGDPPRQSERCRAAGAEGCPLPLASRPAFHPTCLSQAPPSPQPMSRVRDRQGGGGIPKASLGRRAKELCQKSFCASRRQTPLWMQRGGPGPKPTSLHDPPNPKGKDVHRASLPTCCAQLPGSCLFL